MYFQLTDDYICSDDSILSISFSSVGNEIKRLQQILTRSIQTRDGLSILEAKYKRGLGDIRITEESDPLTVLGVIDCQIIIDDPDPARVQGSVFGILENGRSSIDLREVTDGSDPIQIEGKVYGKIVVDDNDPLPGILNIDLEVKLKVITDEPEPISVTGRLKGSLEIDDSQTDLLKITDDPEPFGIQGQISGILVLPEKSSGIGVIDPDE